MKIFGLVASVALFSAALLLTSCGSASTGGSDVPAGRPLSTHIEENAATTFSKAVIESGIIETLRNPGTYTLFVPDDLAVIRDLEEAGLTEEEFLQLDNLEEIIGYHVAIGELDYPNYKAGDSVPTLAGLELKLQASDQNHAYAGNVRLTSPLYDVTYHSNGEYENVDGLLLPPGLSLN